MTAASLLASFSNVVDGTRPHLAAIPNDKLGWRPHTKSYSMAELGAHLVNLPNWALIALTQDSYDVAERQHAEAPVFGTSEELVSGLQATSDAAKTALSAATQETLDSPWTLMANGAEKFTIPKGAVIQGFVIEHMIHHRAQLGVYLRLLNIPVPQTFGPTADFQDL